MPLVHREHADRQRSYTVVSRRRRSSKPVSVTAWGRSRMVAPLTVHSSCTGVPGNRRNAQRAVRASRASGGSTNRIALPITRPVSYTHLRAHETPEHLVCRLLLEKKKKK